MNILIIGGAGYIGSHTNLYLKEKNINTLIIDDLSDGHEEALLGQKNNRIDITDRAKVFSFFEENKIDAVIHFAAKASVGDSVVNPEIYYSDNIIGTKNILDAMVKTNVKNIVFSSSAAIFGEPEEIPMTEEHPKNPINPYGKTKLADEWMLADYDKAYGIKSVSLRYFNAAGCDPEARIGEAHNPERHIIPLLVRAAITGGKFKLFGNDYDTKDGTCLRDYIHVNDLAEAHYLALKYLLDGGETIQFNMGSNEGYTNLEIIKKASEISKKKINYEVAPRREGDPSKLLASNKKVEEILGLKLQFSNLDTIISSAYNWEINRKY
jgi:UDP-glucose 4-epimerase